MIFKQDDQEAQNDPQHAKSKIHLDPKYGENSLNSLTWNTANLKVSESEDQTVDYSTKSRDLLLTQQDLASNASMSKYMRKESTKFYGFRQPRGSIKDDIERSGASQKKLGKRGVGFLATAKTKELPQSKGQHLLSSRPYYGNDTSNIQDPLRQSEYIRDTLSSALQDSGYEEDDKKGK